MLNCWRQQNQDKCIGQPYLYFLRTFRNWDYFCQNMAIQKMIKNIKNIVKILFKKDKKRMTKLIFQKFTFSWKMCPDSKQDIRKSWDLSSVFCTSRYEALWEIFFGKCVILMLILNILPFLIFAIWLFHKWRLLLNCSKFYKRKFEH